MAYDRPNVDDFKAYFVRDFPYAVEEEEEGGQAGAQSDPLDFVIQQDIQKALDRTALMLNEGLCPTQEFFNQVYLLLAAHNLVLNLRNASQGVASQPQWLQSGKAVGGVSESFSIPDRILANPQLSMLTRTGYGMEYLELIFPQLSGQMFFVPGRTLA